MTATAFVTSRGLHVTPAGGGQYDVVDPTGSRAPHRVTNEGDCDCRARQFRHRPCKHLEAVAEYLRFAPVTAETATPAIDGLPAKVAAAWDGVPPPTWEDTPSDDDGPGEGELAEPQPITGGRATTDAAPAPSPDLLEGPPAVDELPAPRSGFATTYPRLAAWSADRAQRIPNAPRRDPRRADDLLAAIAADTERVLVDCAQRLNPRAPPAQPLMAKYREVYERIRVEKACA